MKEINYEQTEHQGVAYKTPSLAAVANKTYREASMTELTTWVKPNGQEIQLNNEEATIEKAIDLGWEPKEDKPRRGRRPKDVGNGDSE